MIPPVVYLGPTLERERARALLPQALVRGPVRRGDLYRDRLLRHSLLVIIDGVFFQDLAVPPREVIDVLADGAIVVGAASMGALRAAECWPAGMRGIGAIYRLFRRGRLTSDDEVAVTFDPEAGRPATLALINVRHALSRARRAGRIEAATAARLVAAAERTYYAERTWPEIARRAGVEPGALPPRRWLEQQDLKRDDAIRALTAVAAWLDEDPTLAHRERTGRGPFRSSDETRELPPDARRGLDPSRLYRGLCRYWIASGRQRRLAATAGRPGRVQLARWARQLTAPDERFSRRLWRRLERSGELDAELFRWRAIEEAARRARRHGLRPRVADLRLAGSELAHAHGFPTWVALEAAALAEGRALHRAILGYRDALARARRLRDEPFGPRTAGPGSGGE